MGDFSAGDNVVVVVVVVVVVEIVVVVVVVVEVVEIIVSVESLGKNTDIRPSHLLCHY